MNHEARCAVHPDVAAVAACARCGQFYCAPDQRLVDGVAYCATCAARPDVDWLEQFRLKYWGKRDGWAWVVGAGSICNLAAVPSVIGAQLGASDGAASVAPLTVAVLLQLASIVLCVAFWFGARWSRIGLLVLPLFYAVLQGLVYGAMVILPAAVLPLIFAIAIYQDTRNRLFFKIVVPHEKLRRLWDRYANNTLARVGFQLSIAGVMLPFFAPFGLGCSILGLRRVDPNARPPIGRKGQAIAGIILGMLGLFIGAGFVFLYASGHHL